MRNQMSLRLRILLLGVLLFFTAFVGLGLAQRSTTSLSGTVTDSTGAIIPNAKVDLTSTAEGFARTDRSNDAGVYLFPDLTPGVYNIKVEVQGFKKAFVNGITLYVGQPVTQDFHLEVGTVAESVTVAGHATLIKSDHGYGWNGYGECSHHRPSPQWPQLSGTSAPVARSELGCEQKYV